MGRSPCCSKEGLNRGAWTALEDKILTDYIKTHGEGKWRNLPKKAGLKRCGKSCRLRWLNYLRPDIKRGNISVDEEELIIRLHKLLGNRWSLIAGRLPGRTDNEIKNYWNTNLGKKVKEHQNSAAEAEAEASKSNKMEGRIGKKRKREAEMAPSPTAGSAKSSTHVVRTRAIRCSRKVFIDYPLPLLPHAQKQIFEYPFDSKTSSQPSTNGDYCLDIQIPQLFENDDEDQNNNNYNDSSDFMFDFNMGEISISDLLKSDFAELGEVNNSNDDILSPSTSDEQAAAAAAAAPLVFSEEMFEDWTSCSSQQNVASNLHCLAPFLDCGEEWFAE